MNGSRNLFSVLSPLSVPHLSPLFQLIVIAVTVHIALVGARITTSLYAISLQASELTIGVLIALFALFPMLLAVKLGRLIDRIGIHRPMLTGALIMTIGCALPGVIGGLTVLYLAVLMTGAGFIAIHLSVQHAVGAMSTAKNASANFSWLALGYSVSSFLGPVLAGFVIEHLHHRASYAIGAGFVVLALMLITLGGSTRMAVPQQRQAAAAGGILELLRLPRMRRIYLVSIVLGSAWDLFAFVMPIHGSRLGFSASTIGLILGSFSAATIVVRLAMQWIARHYSEWQVLTCALLLALACYILFPFLSQPATMMAAAAALGLALGAGQPNVLALLHHASPPGRAAEAVGIRVTISNASQVALPLAFGAAGATLGLFAVFWGMSAMIACGVPIAWRNAFRNEDQPPS
jgi:predicted MFS family arabinose efflux permease